MRHPQQVDAAPSTVQHHSSWLNSTQANTTQHHVASILAKSIVFWGRTAPLPLSFKRPHLRACVSCVPHKQIHLVVETLLGLLVAEVFELWLRPQAWHSNLPEARIVPRDVGECASRQHAKSFSVDGPGDLRDLNDAGNLALRAQAISSTILTHLQAMASNLIAMTSCWVNLIPIHHISKPRYSKLPHMRWSASMYCFFWHHFLRAPNRPGVFWLASMFACGLQDGTVFATIFGFGILN